MDIEYSLEELNRLEAKSESERTPEEQAKLEVLLMKKMERESGVNTKYPYVYSGTNIYISGKYPSDGKYDPNLVDKQLGVYVLLTEILDL